MNKHYKPIIKLLEKRITTKHEQYGLSYQERDDKWMWNRLYGELKEMFGELFSNHTNGSNTINECLDVAIVALLIADNHRIRTESPAKENEEA